MEDSWKIVLICLFIGTTFKGLIIGTNKIRSESVSLVKISYIFTLA